MGTIVHIDVEEAQVTKRGANDPDRRDRIIDAALEVIRRHGVHATTHRLIAAAADVPLGSLTYYFDGLADILEQAFTTLSARMADDYRASLEAATTQDAAREAVVDLICGGYAGADDVRALFEMYSYGNYNATVGALCRDWMFVSRESLSLHFSASTARALDALIEGWPMHQAWERAPLDRRIARATVDAVVDALEPG